MFRITYRTNSRNTGTVARVRFNFKPEIAPKDRKTISRRLSDLTSVFNIFLGSEVTPDAHWIDRPVMGRKYGTQEEAIILPFANGFLGWYIDLKLVAKRKIPYEEIHERAERVHTYVLEGRVENAPQPAPASTAVVNA